MRILLILLMLVAAPAWAEWVRMGEIDETTFYIDPATIRKDGIMRKVWEVQDMKQRGRDGHLSRRYLTEYDCKDERYRTYSASVHSESMATGSTLETWNGTTEWNYIAPATVSAFILKRVCKK